MKNIWYILMYIILLILNIFIGSDITQPLIFVNVIIILINIIYIFFNRKKYIFINNKIDIIFLIYMLSSFIPLIFNKFVSLSNVYRGILENIDIIILYFYAKNLSINNKDKLVNIIIYSSIPVIVIAIDRIYFNFIWNYISNYDSFRIIYRDEGILANFNYPNTLGIYLASLIFLIYGKLENKNNIINIINRTYFFILFLLLCLSLSKASIILYILFTMLYYMFNRKERIKLYNISSTIISSVICIILFYITTYLKLNNCISFILLLIIIIINISINYLFMIFKVFYKINYKKIFILFVSTFILITTLIVINLKYSKPYIIDKNIGFDIKNINKEKIKLKIEIDSASEQQLKIYTITNNDYRETYLEDKINSVKEYNIVTKDINSLYIEFNNVKNKFRLNKIYINDKEYIVNYKYLPKKLGDMAKSFIYGEQNIKYRFDYYKDAIKLIKTNPLFGYGNNSWRYLYKSIQKYDYNTKEVHSFLIDTFLSYGIIGFISIIIIIIYILNCVFNKKNDKDIAFSLLLLITHSIIDFDMSFLLIKVYVFILISILNSIKYDKGNNIKINNILIIINIILVILNILILKGTNNYKKTMDFNDKYSKFVILDEEYKYKKINNMNTYNLNDMDIKLKYLYKYSEEEKYNSEYIIKTYYELIEKEIEYGKTNKYYINTLHNYLKNSIPTNKYNITELLKRLDTLNNLYKLYYKYGIKENDKYLIQESNYIKDYIIKENNNNIKNLKNYKNTNYPKYYFDKHMEDYYDTINRISFIKENNYEK